MLLGPHIDFSRTFYVPQAYPLFTMSIAPGHAVGREGKLVSLQRMQCRRPTKIGGAGRDRTDDLKLAKLPLSQVSYGAQDVLPIANTTTVLTDNLLKAKCREALFSTPGTCSYGHRSG